MGTPNLLTAQQHRFVLAIIEGKTQAEAYLAARFPRNSNQQLKEISKKQASTNGGRMMKEPIVVGALARAQEASLALASTNLASLVADLQEARSVALQSDPPQTNGAVAATMGIAKLLGLAVDKAQVEVLHKPGFASKALELSEEEWKRQFAAPLTGKALGKRQVGDT
jgi:phage terminase small subunit